VSSSVDVAPSPLALHGLLDFLDFSLQINDTPCQIIPPSGAFLLRGHENIITVQYKFYRTAVHPHQALVLTVHNHALGARSRQWCSTTTMDANFYLILIAIKR
jgi:hypothetical protein